MRLARVLGAIGRALISAGVIVLLFVAYQLWGTGIQHAQAQGSLENDFAELLSSDAAAEAQQVNTAVDSSAPDPESSGDDDADAAPAGPASAVEVDLSSVEFSPQFLAKLYPEEGSSLARIVIADINVDQIVVEGVSVEDLRKGPGHYSSTPNPGQAGNAAIAGHRTTYGAPFHRIDELDPGAEIVVTTLQGSFVYRVKENVAADGSVQGHFIVSPSDTWVLAQGDENLLTLTACHPKYSARQRIIVQAELVGEPAVTIPRAEAEGLAPVELSAGEADERASEAPVDDSQVVISDDVAADDDPTLGGQDDETAAAAAAAGTTTDGGDDGGIDEAGSSGQSTDETGDEIGTADLTGDEAQLTTGQGPFEEAEDFGEGLNGDRSKIGPAIMWGLASLAIWLAAWFIGQRLNRKWTLYAVSLVPYGLVLWACFVNVDQALPSY